MAPEEDDLEPLSALGPFIRPLPPEETERLRCTYSDREGGWLTRESLILMMLETEAGWLARISAWTSTTTRSGRGPATSPSRCRTVTGTSSR